MVKIVHPSDKRNARWDKDNTEQISQRRSVPCAALPGGADHHLQDDYQRDYADNGERNRDSQPLRSTVCRAGNVVSQFGHVGAS
jgi:hypothetical protein